MHTTRRWPRVVLWMLLALTALVVLRQGIADLLAERAPTVAVQWWPWHAEAMARLVVPRPGVSAPQTDTEAAAGAARRMLKISPVDGAPYRALAHLAQERGDAVEAASLLELASRWQPRERSAHAWLVEHYAARGQWEDALRHVDVLLRLSPKGSEGLRQLLDRFLADADATDTVVGWLGRQELPWREKFLQQWIRQDRNSTRLGEVLAPLREADFPLSAVELDAWIRQLQRLNRGREAYFLWIGGLAPEARALLGNVFNGGFEGTGDAGGFDWRVERIPGAWVTREGIEGAGGLQALRIDFQRRRVPFSHVRQWMALWPGQYRLSGRVHARKLVAERGLRWEVLCEGRKPAGVSLPHRGDLPWQAFQVDFEVPAEGCTMQLLRLRLDARSKAEQWTSGSIWYDDLKVVRTTFSEPIVDPIIEPVVERNPD